MTRAFSITLALAASAACLSTAASAQPEQTTARPSPRGGDTIRLTDAERQEILDRSSEERAAAARGELVGQARPPRGIHGEVGAMIGSHGTRGIYGVADVPLGDNAGATVMFENSRYGYRSPRR